MADNRRPSRWVLTWLHADPPKPKLLGKLDHDMLGKWCIVRPETTIDEAWGKVVALVDSGQVVHAKASGRSQAARHGGSFLICVYTPDWRDVRDVMRVRELLRSAGFTEQLGYKRDVDTVAGIYGTDDEWWYRA